MSSTISSQSPPADEGERMPVAQGNGELEQPRDSVVHQQSETSENSEQTTSGHDTDSGPTKIPMQSGSSESATQDQKGYEDHGSEPEFSDDGEHVRPVRSKPETIYFNLELDTKLGSTGSYQETCYSIITEPGQPSYMFSPVSETPVVLSSSADGSAWEELRRIERLNRAEKDRMSYIGDYVIGELVAHHRLCYEGYMALEMENERLQREITTPACRLILPAIHTNSLGGDDPETNLGYDKVASNITTVAAAITIVATQIERWKHMGTTDTGQVIIPSEGLGQLSLDLSNASSRMVDLQRNYAELSKDFDTLSCESQVTTSLRDEKDDTIASVTAEGVQWKDTEASRAQQITAVIEEKDRTIELLNAEVDQWRQLDPMKAEQIGTSPSQTSEFQKRYDVQSKELRSIGDELQAKKFLVEEKERVITTLTAEVEQQKSACSIKEEQIVAERRDKEKLQHGLNASSSQVAELQRRYDEQSQDIVSIRNELQTKVALLKEKEHTISILTKVAQGESEDSVKVNQIATARRGVEKLQSELTSQFADLQKHFEARLISVRDELSQIEVLHRNETYIARGEHAPSQQIARELEKNEEMEELRRDLATANDRNAGLQRSCEALSREATALRDELKEKMSQNEGTISSLTAQADQLRRTDVKKAERITTLLEQIEKFQKDLSTSIYQLTDLQDRYESQSHEIIAVRNDLEGMTSSNEEKGRIIATLTAEVEKLQQDLSASASKLAELQGRYEVQSRELTSVHDDLQAKTSVLEGMKHTIASLGAERDQWKLADATKAERIAAIARKVGELQRDLYL